MGDVISGVGLGIFGLCYRALSPKPQEQVYDSSF